jgi:UDP-N-acetyl-2-amino-2-deoxyglucuronate dehydrogenase
LKNFILIGAAGYIAPRHMKAIHDTGNNLLAALDPHDSVGVLDHYFPHCDFFTEFERFDRHCEKLKRSGTTIDYLTVCSPNYLHDAHIRFGLRLGADVICEKPIALNPWNVEALTGMEKESGKNVYAVHQLRHHPSILALKEKVSKSPADKVYTINLEYITPRGNWYQYSWKGDMEKSGGIITNIGLHFFDMLLWIFGEVKSSSITNADSQKATGQLQLERATVNWLLSIDEKDIAQHETRKGYKAVRSLQVDGEEVSFSSGFEELHTSLYKEVLAGAGIRLNEVLSSIRLVHSLKEQSAITIYGE